MEKLFDKFHFIERLTAVPGYGTAVAFICGTYCRTGWLRHGKAVPAP